MNDARKHSSTNAIEDQAAAWVLREDRGLSAVEQDELLHWLSLDSRHGESLSRQRQNWRRLDLLGQWKPEHSLRPNRDLLAPHESMRITPTRFPGRNAIFALAASVTIVFAGFALWLRLMPDGAAGNPSTIAAIETRSLPDGSHVELNRGAVLTAMYTATERNVRLEHGEAHFSVKKDAARPFIVSAGGVNVRAIGTAFNVRLGGRAVEVLVTEGRVRVDQREGPSGERMVVVPELERGERTVVPLEPAAAPQVAVVTPEEMDQFLAWQPRMLEFTSAPLRSVVAEFNRRNTPIHLLVMDSDLAEIEVSASLRSDNVEGFLRLLEAGFGVRVQRQGEIIRLNRP